VTLATREWIKSFVAGVNCGLNSNPLRHEFAVFHLKSEPWAVADILLLGRLFAPDSNWIVWGSLMRVHGTPDWDVLWANCRRKRTA
jgi:hypothetical protein